jgi:hypothetical protein
VLRARECIPTPSVIFTFGLTFESYKEFEGVSLNYHRLLMDIILMVIGGYFIVGHWWLLMAILLVAISGYFINGY